VLVYRQVLPSEIDKIRDHYLRLDSDERILRFFGPTCDAVIAARCDRLDWRRAHFVGVFIDGTLRGVAELELDHPEGQGSGEIAVSVEKAWRSRGIGAELLRRAIVVGRNHGATSISMICLLDNEPMRRLASHFADKISIHDGTVEADLAVPPPTYETLWQEIATGGFDLVDAWLDICGSYWPDAVHKDEPKTDDPPLPHS
jgi:GNAT superfamily N-acetyltransferase